LSKVKYVVLLAAVDSPLKKLTLRKMIINMDLFYFFLVVLTLTTSVTSARRNTINRIHGGKTDGTAGICGAFGMCGTAGISGTVVGIGTELSALANRTIPLTAARKIVLIAINMIVNFILFPLVRP
jgi:hypothetical protein